jgi:uncharacterized repeat protein (TIGR01451 family)
MQAKIKSFYSARSLQTPQLDKKLQTLISRRLTGEFGWFFVCLWIGSCSWMAPAKAEGSKELVANGGSRPHTEWRTDTTASIKRRTLLKVYANQNEVINLGSSAVNVGSGNIRLFSSSANVDTDSPLLDCKNTQSGKGILDTRAKELAGSAPASGGYEPCVYSVPATGFYQVIFYGPNGALGATDPNTSASIANPSIDAEQKSTVSMWDITVRSSATSTTNLNGRVFTDYLALITGASGRYVKSKFYILTSDGYRYLTDLGVGVGIDPIGFIFFANKTGLTYANGKTLYHSGKASDNVLTLPLNGQVNIPSPSTFSYPTFFNPPAAATIAGLNYPSTAQAPAPAANFSFAGGTGGTANTTPQGVGGTFSFNAPQAGNYQIIIDTNGDGNYDPATDLTLGGVVTSGNNTVSWDGKDNGGANVPPRANNLPYDTRITLRGGEYHFPLLDVENAPDGFKIEMLNPPGAFVSGTNTTTIYFDERDYTANSTNIALGCSTTSVCDARNGVDSATGAHKFTGNYGDQKAIDTWIYFPSTAVSTSFSIFKTKISGKVWHDVNNSAYNTFNNIGDPATEIGTNAGGLKAVLVRNSLVIATAPVAADGTYIFTDVTNNQSNLTIRLSVPTDATSSANLPINWTNTSPLTTSPFTIGTTNIVNKDFGIRQLLPNVLLVKRITAINGQRSTATGIRLDTYNNDSSYPYDDNANANITPTTTYPQKGTDKWPRTVSDTSSSFLLGSSGGLTVKPKDELEYTIYFLSAGESDASNVNLCDLIPTNQTFVLNSYSGGIVGLERGIALSIGTNAQVGLTNANDADSGRYYPPGQSLPTSCKIAGLVPTNTNGAVVVNLGLLPKPTATAATNGYGYIRFRTKIN